MGILCIWYGYPMVRNAKLMLNGCQLLREEVLTVSIGGAWYPSEGVQTGNNQDESRMKVRSKYNKKETAR